jgi:very-short-patch-repair endonuclease
MSDLAEKILARLRTAGPAKAKELADALGVDRTVVNNALYGELRGKVRQRKDYTWSIPEASRARPNGQAAASTTYASLFNYYLDCLSEDDDGGVRVFVDSKYDIDYVEIQEWPFDLDEPNFTAEPIRKLIARQKRDARKKALWLGYPALVRHIRGRSGWEGAFLTPLLLWPQDPDASDIGFLPEPALNMRALEGVAGSENVLEEAALLADELGLDSSDAVPLDEIAARLRDLRPEWPWKEPLTPAPFRPYGDLRKLEENGIYNAAVLALAERSPYTIGLERELADLRTVSDAAILRSSLGVLLGQPGPEAQIEGPLLEPAPLNAEQRTAVQQALAQPLTVITGPPGTGKSQVVTAILVNAAWRGLRVLFASKNNKAVDVVMQRMNALAARPVMLRLGSRAFQEQLAQHITAILSAQPTEDDRRAYESILPRLQAESEKLRACAKETQELVTLRNKVDNLERTAEEARGILPESTFATAASVPTSELESRIEKLRAAIRRSTAGEASVIERLFWTFLKEGRRQQVVVETALLSECLTAMGFEDGQPNDPSALLFRGVSCLEALKAASAYTAALEDLFKLPDTGALAATVAQRTQAVASLSADVWERWTTLVPDRLTQSDRAALGDYAAILRTISKVDEEGGTVAGDIWRRYYSLAPKTTKALPCWAVTSLSARGRVPFTSADFDVLVIDEASQCDIASALPLLFRAKRAVIIGDPQQLRHISRLSEHRDQVLMVKHGLLDNPGPSWGYRANSLYDLAATRISKESVVELRDHHRSHADIIGFSNAFFYANKLRVATDYRRLRRPDGPAVRWINVTGKVVRPTNGGAVNQSEASAVVDELRRIAISQRFVGEIGVVTPFRAQANLIEELVNRDDTLASVLASRNFISETAHKFQGDERDLILFSPVVSQGTPAGAIGFLKSQGNIFNVGITRARASLIVVGDASACAACDVEYLREFSRYVARRKDTADEHQREQAAASGRDYPPVARPELVSDWERKFYPALVDAGIRAIPQFEIDQYVLDFAILRPNGRRLNIEIDGERYHRDWDGELARRDQLRNLRLIEMGWDVMRFWVYEIRDRSPSCIARILQWIRDADAKPPIFEDGRTT